MTTTTDVLADIDEQQQWQEELYRHLHQNPELPFQERETAAEITRRLTSYGYEVQQIGGGVVGVLRNGPGRTVLFRADIDALPVQEATGLPYASTRTVLDAEGSGGGTFVKTVDGVRVGFVGVVTDELSTLVSPAGLSGLTISPALATANARPTPSRTVTSPTARRMWSWSSATRTPPSRPARSPRAWTPSLPATHMCPSPRP